MAYTERYLDAASSGGDGTTNAISGANAAWATFGAAIAGVGAGPAAAPTRVNARAGIYPSTTTTLTFNTAGAANNPVCWRGYKLVPGDQDGNNLAVAGVDIPSLTYTTGVTVVSGNYQIFSNLDFTSGSNTGSTISFTGLSIRCYGCRFRQQAGSTFRCVNMAQNSTSLIRCYISAVPGQNCVSGSSFTNGLFLGNYLAGGGAGIVYTTGNASILWNIFDSIGGDVLSFTTGYATIAGNSIYAPTGHGATWSSTPIGPSCLVNNHFEGVNQAGKAAINNGSGTASMYIRPVSNSYFDCAANVQGQGDVPNIFDVGTLAGSGFNNAVGGDFTPSALLQALGFPGPFETISAFRSYLDLGAVQAAAAAGGGGIGRQPMFRIRGA